MNCEVIRDLLPLYVDNVCSENSKRLIEEHIKSCESCRKELEMLENCAVTRTLRQEKDGVVRRERKRKKRATFTVGLVFAAIFTLPVLICLIVNLAVGKGLSWFFIVLTALMLAASLIVVPLMVERRKFLWTLGAGTGTLLLLLATCAIYARGNWFFVTAFSVLFGLCVVFAPILVNCEPLKTRLGKNRFFAVLGVDTVTYFAMMLAIGSFTHWPTEFGRTTIAVTVPVLALLVGIALLCRFVPKKRVKTGLSFLWSGIAVFFSEWFIGTALGQKMPLPRLRPWDWHTAKGLNGNVLWCALLTGALLCVILLSTKKRRNVE